MTYKTKNTISVSAWTNFVKGWDSVTAVAAECAWKPSVVNPFGGRLYYAVYTDGSAVISFCFRKEDDKYIVQRSHLGIVPSEEESYFKTACDAGEWVAKYVKAFFGWEE